MEGVYADRSVEVYNSLLRRLKAMVFIEEWGFKGIFF